MRFGSVCSGVEAASVAFGPLGWEPAWLAEVDVAASAVLAHRYGATAPVYPLPNSERAMKRIDWGDRLTNWGDMTKLPDLVRSGEAEAPDVLCGGTPCQSFSVAGRREGLTDGRGQLTLSFVDLADAIDIKRAERGDEPCIIFWENVPGVLSDKTNAFGCFLAALAGEDVALEPPGPKWSNAGCVFGPQRTIAWRILDAQHFGVAQRRRRVFVVASARDGFDPCEVLFEREGVRRDTAPSREAGQEVAGTLASRTGAGGFPGTDESLSGYVQPVWPAEIASTLNAAFGSKLSLEDQHVNGGCPLFVPAVSVNGDLTHTLTGEGFDASEDGTGRGVPTIAFSSKDYGADATDEMSPTLRAGGHADSHANAGVPPAVTVSLRGREGGATAELGGEIATALRASSGGGDKSHVLAEVIGFQSSQSGVRLVDTHATLDANNGPRRHNGVVQAMAVRRLTPTECERLQGFPDGHTAVPIGNADAADGPRYKQMGNSWAVPAVRWIGKRIEQQVAVDPMTVWLLCA